MHGIFLNTALIGLVIIGPFAVVEPVAAQGAGDGWSAGVGAIAR